MAIQTAEIVPGEVNQESWDAKFATTTQALKDMGGIDTQSSDGLPEGAVNKYDTGVPPATQDDLPDGVTHVQYPVADETKLAGIEENAKGDQTGAEIRDSVVALGDDDRKIVITRPTSGNKKVYATNVNGTDDKLEIEHSDTPEV